MGKKLDAPDAQTSNSVIVGCKIPNGLLMQVGKVQVAINGSNSSSLINGFGTTKVDAEFWDAWLARNSGLSFVRNGLIFAHAKKADVKAEAKEKADIKTGLEALDPAAKPKGIQAED